MSLIRRFAAAAVLFAALPLLSAQTSKTTQISKTTQTSTAQKAQAAAKTSTAASGEKLDINTATADQLKTFNGIGDAYAKRIIDGRPYAQKTQLVTRGVLPQATYNKIKDDIIASRAKK
jgi:competence protein ComEA